MCTLYRRFVNFSYNRCVETGQENNTGKDLEYLFFRKKVRQKCLRRRYGEERFCGVFNRRLNQDYQISNKYLRWKSERSISHLWFLKKIVWIY